MRMKELPMKRQLTTLSILITFVAVTVFAPASPLMAQADTGVPVTGTGVTNTGIPVTFTGTIELNKFKAKGSDIVVDGTLSGTVTGLPSGPQTINNVKVKDLAVVIPQPTSGVTTQQAAVTCPILHLVLGPLDLDLLGLVIHLDTVVLDLTAVPGAGNLLGNLLCAIVGLLDNPSVPINILVDLLNAFIALLESL
jgi:hypothetical protein